MRIKVAGRAKTKMEMLERIAHAMERLPLDEVDHFEGINFYQIKP